MDANPRRRPLRAALPTVIFVGVVAAAASCAQSDPSEDAGEDASTGEDASAGASEGSAGLDGEPDCSFVTTFEDGTLRFGFDPVSFSVGLDGPRQELDLYPPTTLARLAPIATGISAREPGVYIFEYSEDPPFVDGSFVGEGWFDRYSFRVDEERNLWRLHQVGRLPAEAGWIVTEASAVEQVDPAAIATLAHDCSQPIVQRRWECVYEVVTTAATVATCGEANAGVMQ